MSILPRELVYFFLAAPILLAPVFQRDIFELEPEFALRSIAANYLPFVLVPAGLYAMYRWLWPVRATPRSLLAAILLHAVCGAVVAVAIGLAIHPVFVVVVDGAPPIAGFAASCVIMTWMFILPAIVVQELRARAEAQRQAASTAQLDALRSRTHPHFLFNALNTIASLVRDDPELAERTIERLADLLRYSLDSGRLAGVPLAREIEMVRDYLEIQRARFGELLRYSIDLPPALAGVVVPPLLLQPLIENAVLHGIANRAEGGSLRLEVRERGGRLELSVEDDGPGPGNSQHSGNGLGLPTVRQRLELLYGDTGALAIRAGDRGGYRAELALPCRR